MKRKPNADPFLEGDPPYPHGLWSRLHVVGLSEDEAWLQRVAEWPGTSKRVRSLAGGKLKCLKSKIY